MNEDKREKYHKQYLEQQERERKSERIADSRLPLHTRDSYRLDETFIRTSGNARGVEAITDLIEDKIEPPIVLLVGVAGVGKTRLAIHAGWKFLERNQTVIYYQAEELLSELQMSFDNRGEYRRIIEDLEDADLVIIDDLASENPTPWRASTMDMIIDKRYRAMAPLIITSNKLNEISERILDRSREGAVVVITGESWRSKKEKHGKSKPNNEAGE